MTKGKYLFEVIPLNISIIIAQENISSMKQKTFQIKHNKYITISLFILFILFIIGLYLFDDGTLKDVIFLYYILIFSILILLVESLFTKIIIDENCITKKTLLTNKKYFKENITSIEIFKKEDLLE